MSNIVPFEEKRALAQAFARSGLFGLRDESQALALMAICEAEGLHPAKAAQMYHIIQGRPSIKADALLARFQESGGKVHWQVYTDERVIGVFSHPQGGSVTIEWTIERARKIGLASKDVWKQYPRNMLRARCIAEGVRAVYPGIATGIYTSEEVADMPPAARDMGAVEIVTPTIPDDRRAELQQAIAGCESSEDLAALWKSMTKEERQAMAESKDAAKVRLAGVGRE